MELMKRIKTISTGLVLILANLILAGQVFAQDDDIYFVPKKKEKFVDEPRNKDFKNEFTPNIVEETDKNQSVDSTSNYQNDNRQSNYDAYHPNNFDRPSDDDVFTPTDTVYVIEEHYEYVPTFYNSNPGWTVGGGYNGFFVNQFWPYYDPWFSPGFNIGFNNWGWNSGWNVGFNVGWGWNSPYWGWGWNSPYWGWGWNSPYWGWGWGWNSPYYGWGWGNPGWGWNGGHWGNNDFNNGGSRYYGHRGSTVSNTRGETRGSKRGDAYSETARTSAPAGSQTTPLTSGNSGVRDQNTRVNTAGTNTGGTSTGVRSNPKDSNCSKWYRCGK